MPRKKIASKIASPKFKAQSGGQLLAQFIGQAGDFLREFENGLVARIVAELQPHLQARAQARASAPRQSEPSTSVKSRGGRPATTLRPEHLDRLKMVIQERPGLRSEEIYKVVPIPPALAKKGLHKLRELKLTKTKGEKRSTTYWPK